MINEPNQSQKWAQFRFGVVAPLLVSPPKSGELRPALRRLSEKVWPHPLNKKPTRFGFSTIERWYHQARKSTDPLQTLCSKIRRDKGDQRSLAASLRKALKAQYQAHPSWSYQLHYDNLKATAQNDPKWESLPSYATVRRYLLAQGMRKQKRSGSKRALEPSLAPPQREVRSYEMEHVNALWHLDFHHGSQRVLSPRGEWVKPLLLGIIDDHSRLACHAQWYLAEDAEHLVHGLCQALQKRGLPRALMTDNGSAMQAEETGQGLIKLGILHEFTLAYSPYQNGKQEVFWGQVEGRLLAMLENVRDLDLKRLNEATQAWVELEYNRKVHTEIGVAPVKRFSESPDLGRPCPRSEALRQAFTCRRTRQQRYSDGTLTLHGSRFEIPSRYRNLTPLIVRYARWDLSYVSLVDPNNEQVLCRIFPVDKHRNADGQRRAVSLPDVADPEPAVSSDNEPAPLLKALLAEYAATGRPMPYLPKDEIESGDA